MRSFKRDPTFSPCAIFIENIASKAYILNFSRMGMLISTDNIIAKKKYVSVMYRNEKNELLRMLTYVVHSSKRNNQFIAGLQFVGLEKIP